MTTTRAASTIVHDIMLEAIINQTDLEDAMAQTGESDENDALSSNKGALADARLQGAHSSDQDALTEADGG